MKSRKSGGILDAEFLNRPTLIVAEALLGNHLCRKIQGKVERHVITEVEAYDGFEDKASHAHKGKTPRNNVMFGPAGHWYVYLCYGMHWLLNIVTGAENYPAAILFRGLDKVSGPGRITKALQIDGSLNQKACQEKTGLWMESSGERVSPVNIERMPRVGIDYAGPDWSQKPYRFVIRGR